MPRKVFRDSDESEDEHEDSDSPEGQTQDVEDKDDVASLESDSDSAPEDVGFREGKLTALQKVKDTLKQIEKDRQKKKLKRKEHDTIYKEQKKKKLEALAQSRLSEDILDEISVRPKAKVKGKALDSKVTDEEDTSMLSNEEDEMEPDLLGQEANTIPLDSMVRAVHVKEVKPKTSIEKAMAFRQNHLYGTKVRREPAREKIARRRKKKVQFS